MAFVEYDSFPVSDPTTKAPRTDLWGAKLTAVFHDTNIPVPGLLEAGSHAPLTNPFNVTAIGFTPSIAIENGPVRIDYVSSDGNYRTPVTSFSGAQARMDEAVASAAASAAAAQQAIELADVVDLVAGTGITLTPSPSGVVIASTGGGSGGGFTGTVTASQISNRSATGETVLTGTPTQGREALQAGQSNVKVSGSFTGDAAPAGAVVNLTTDQTVGGKKTFTVAPVVPANSFPQSAVVGLTTALQAADTSTLVPKSDTYKQVRRTGTNLDGPWPTGVTRTGYLGIEWIGASPDPTDMQAGDLRTEPV